MKTNYKSFLVTKAVFLLKHFYNQTNSAVLIQFGWLHLYSFSALEEESDTCFCEYTPTISVWDGTLLWVKWQGSRRQSSENLVNHLTSP